MDKFCEDCIHNEVCQYGAIPPHEGRCNDKETLEDLKEKIETYKSAYRIMSDAFECEVTKNTRSKGKWIKMSDRYGIYFACNKCGYDREKSISNFCPNCGLPMQKGGTV